MTRAALLQLFDSPETLPTAVQDLEQLAQAFPYCQTAHLLLAKAAHDQGSMLAGQRLRRAATYAADRHLLRLLLESPVRQPVAEEAPTLLLPEETQPTELVQESKQDEAVVPSIPIIVEEAVPVIAEPQPEPLPISKGAAPDSVSEESQVPTVDEPAPSASAEVSLAEPISATTVDTTESAAEPAVALHDEITAEVSPEITSEAEPVEPAPAEVEVVQEETAPQAETELDAEPEAAPLPIRPSVEAGTARFEFGLNTNLEAGFTAYQLPELLADEPAVIPIRVAPATASAFLGSADLTYALGGGSRCGYAIQATATEQPAVETPGEVLPPVGEFFEPDALLLEHLASQPLPPPPAPSSFELIDSFLRRAPQRRRGIVTLLTVPEQADLSIRSTQAESGLASESLARILAGQGKIDRAITVYERLMVRQPEKSAYFAVQIELLRNPPTPSS